MVSNFEYKLCIERLSKYSVGFKEVDSLKERLLWGQIFIFSQWTSPSEGENQWILVLHPLLELHICLWIIQFWSYLCFWLVGEMWRLGKQCKLEERRTQIWFEWCHWKFHIHSISLRKEITFWIWSRVVIWNSRIEEMKNLRIKL